MQARQQGFTLIELIVVIVILGIMAATAMPKFVDLSADAYDAQVKSIGGSLNSWSTINYAKYKAANGTSTGATQINSSSLCANALLTNVTLSGIDNTKITISGPASAVACADGAVTECTIKHSSGTTAGFTFNMVCTG